MVDAQKIKQQDATQKLELAAKELAANFFRIVRGTGVPEYLMRKVAAFTDALDGYANAFGHLPRGDVLQAMLQYPRDPALDWESQRVDQLLAEEAICRAALQLLASGLLDERAERDKALGDLRAAVSRIVERQNLGARRRSAALEARNRKPNR